MATKTATRPTAADLPTIRPDRLGYVLEAEWVDGFFDRPELPVKARRQIALLAERYAPDELSDAQRTLLASRSEERASDLLRALAEDEADLDEAFAEGLYDSLDQHELSLAREQSYPLSIGEVEALTGATARQLRHWEEQSLLHMHSFGTQRRYLRGGVLRAMALVKQEQHVLATLGKTVKEPTTLVKLLGLSLRDSADPETRAAAAQTFMQVGRMLGRSIGPVKGTRVRASARLAGSDSASNKGDVHVVASEKGWKVTVEGASRARSTHPTQADAANAGRDVARKNRSELLIHGRDGRIRARNTYGNDPRPPRG